MFLLMLLKIFSKLVESPYVDSIDWARWHFFWVDERVVPKHHDDSNYKLAYDHFLTKVFIQHIPLPHMIFVSFDSLLFNELLRVS